MHIRRATSSDVSAIADISVEAILANNDPLFSWLAPGRLEFPEDFRYSFVRKERARMRHVGIHTFVAETDGDEPGTDGKQQVVGVAVWDRIGETEKAKAWQKDSWFNIIERPLNALRDRYNSLVYPCRAFDTANVEQNVSIPDGFEDIEDLWRLRLILTKPDFQRRGVASMLIDWGIERAKEDAVFISLEASPVGRGLYRKKGFVDIEEVPIADGVASNMAMLWGHTPTKYPEY